MVTSTEFSDATFEFSFNEVESTDDSRRALIEELSKEIAVWSAELNERLA